MTAQSEQSTTHYWLASQQLAVGSVVEPGTWYKIVSNSGGHNHALLEEVYERIRRDKYSSLPSRHRSMYLFDNIDTAHRFKNDNSWNHVDLYVVEIVNMNANTVKLNSDFVVTSTGNSLLSTNELVERANTYWSSVNSECTKPEVLVESPVRIIQKIII